MEIFPNIDLNDCLTIQSSGYILVKQKSWDFELLVWKVENRMQKKVKKVVEQFKNIMSEHAREGVWLDSPTTVN